MRLTIERSALVRPAFGRGFGVSLGGRRRLAQGRSVLDDGRLMLLGEFGAMDGVTLCADLGLVLRAELSLTLLA